MARMRSTLLGAGLLVGLAVSAYGETIQLQGKVVDAEGAPVQGATVRLERRDTPR